MQGMRPLGAQHALHHELYRHCWHAVGATLQQCRRQQSPAMHARRYRWDSAMLPLCTVCCRCCPAVLRRRVSGDPHTTHPEPENVRVSVVMLMTRTCPTLAALTRRLLVLWPGPSTSMPEPWLATDSSSPPLSGAVTWAGPGKGAVWQRGTTRQVPVACALMSCIAVTHQHSSASARVHVRCCKHTSCTWWAGPVCCFLKPGSIMQATPVGVTDHTCVYANRKTVGGCVLTASLLILWHVCNNLSKSCC